MNEFQTFAHPIDRLAVEMMRHGIPLRALNINFLTFEEQGRMQEMFDNDRAALTSPQSETP